MPTMEDVIRVGTAVDCRAVDANSVVYPRATCRHNAVGCYFVLLLQAMFRLNITYITFDPDQLEEGGILSMLRNGTIDIYARPVALRQEILDSAYPLQAIFTWRIGFILRREHKRKMLRKFYSKPFGHSVWFSLYGMTLLVPVLFYLLSRWEKTLGFSAECSVLLECLLTVGGFCQHTFPVETTTFSRRTAYFTFFLFSYVIYTFYTSNLLSHIVSDKENTMTLTDLSQSDYNYLFLEGIKEYQNKILNYNISSIFKQIGGIPVVNTSTGLEAVRSNKTALLSDYTMVYREITKTFSNKEICDLIKIDLFSRIHKYMITSKTFKYKEQIKISTLRMQQSGILKRMTATNIYTPLECSMAVEVTTSIEQISSLMLVLLCCYIASVFILLCEMMHHRRYRLFPYVE